jgi:tRNA-2-methylthio-N6-dimethylallyladenosine synthase
MQARIGSRQRVLVEKRSTRDPRELAGKTECNRWVNFPGDARLIGRFVEVDITAAMMNSYRGRLAASATARPHAAS